MAVILATQHPKAQCVDLRAMFADRFRFAWDESYQAERPEFRAVEAPWLTIIPGKYGRIFPWGGRVLAAYSNSRSARRHALETLDGVAVRQGGGRCPEVIVTFDVTLIETVAQVVGAKRAFRKPPPEQAAHLRGFQFGPRLPGMNASPDALDSTKGLASEETSS